MTSANTYTFEDILGLFREQEEPEQVIVLTDDSRLQKLIATWPMVVLETREPDRVQPANGSVATTWSWLWSHREVDIEDLARKLGESPTRLRQTLDVARGNRLVYPDGTTNQYAVQYLRARIARELGAPAPRGRK